VSHVMLSSQRHLSLASQRHCHKRSLCVSVSWQQNNKLPSLLVCSFVPSTCADSENGFWQGLGEGSLQAINETQGSHADIEDLNTILDTSDLPQDDIMEWETVATPADGVTAFVHAICDIMDSQYVILFFLSLLLIFLQESFSTSSQRSTHMVSASYSKGQSMEAPCGGADLRISQVEIFHPTA
jgi:hypothetical protein